MSYVDELQQAAETAARNAGPSVVRIGRGPGRGAGVVVAPGVVVTNAHNLRGPEATITFADGRSEKGRPAGIDVDGDLAVLTLDTGDVPAISWADAEAQPRLGTPVFALANTPGHGLRVGFGLVSSVGRTFRGPRGRRVGGSVEHTAPLGRGSSGGPLVDGEGRLLGINTHRLGDGFYLALPADSTLRSRIDALTRGEAPTHRRLGIGIAPPFAARRLRRAVGLPERDGLLVRAVEEGSPADRAGLRQGDLVVSASGNALTSPDDLFEALDALTPDSSLALRVVRGVDEIDVRVSFDDTAQEGSA
ncbi:MAG: serine protease [Actinobacteria bacterium]|nr:serine protease [Actinomycetota bacterium]